MGCSCRKVQVSAEESKFYILGTIAKKRSCSIHLAYRIASGALSVDYTASTEGVEVPGFDHTDDKCVPKKQSYRHLTDCQTRDLDELCSNGTLRILKRVTLPENESASQYLEEKFLKEKDALESFQENKWAVKLYETFRLADSLYLSLEYIWRGTLYDYIRYNGPLSLKLTKNFALQIVQIVEELHSNHWTHRDITSANIMIHKGLRLKLIDFEFAKRLNSEYERTTSFLGTKYSMPPEVYNCDPDLHIQSEYGKECDFWYIGVIIYEMITGEFPFGLPEGNEGNFYEMITNSPQSLDLTKVEGLEATDLIKGLLTSNFQERLGHVGGVNEIKNHIFFNSLVGNMAHPYCKDVSIIQERTFRMFEV